MWEHRDSSGHPGHAPGIFDPAPLNLKQIWVLCAAAMRELLWGLRAVSGEVEHWRLRARCAPDAPLRADALGALADKRTHLDGAALFWILPRRRSRRLLALLVAYEIALEFLDNTNERAADVGTANGRQLHLALPEALLLDGAISDYYLRHPWQGDGGYLGALVRSCRGDCASLPRFELVSAAARSEARRCQVLALNHDPDPARREAALREWARRECPEELWEGCSGEEGVRWFELSAAATASLTVHVLLALGAEAASTQEFIDSARGVYFPGLSLATTMLDSYVDRAEDEASAGHSYIAHYGDPGLAIDRLAQILERSIHDARRLHIGQRHAVLAACMVAMYLSRDSAREEHSRPASARLLRSGGSLTRLLLPILRLWRIAYALRSA
jgi:tetraprenyl-beta-curcumene synthase